MTNKMLDNSDLVGLINAAPYGVFIRLHKLFRPAVSSHLWPLWTNTNTVYSQNSHL